VLPGEMSDTNCHLEAGVFNNHADAADFDPNLIKLSVPCTGLHFFPVST
jgi:hypothetical protein